MKCSSSFCKIAVLGPGLLGGSVALAVKCYLAGTEVRLWGRRRESLELAEKRKAADIYTTDLKTAVQGADLIVLASPIGVMRTLAEQFLPYLEKKAIVTDVGSVKGSVHRELGQYLGDHKVDFIGSHPMAGSEKQGIEHAEATLFQHACIVVTNDEHLPSEKRGQLGAFWSSLGGSCIYMNAEEHDQLVARVSHLPHALAALCVQSACAGSDLSVAARLASTGFRDTTRVAEGSPSMWAEILLENGDAVMKSLQEADQQLSSLKAMIKSRDKAGLHKWLAEAKEKRRQVAGNH